MTGTLPRRGTAPAPGTQPPQGHSSPTRATPQGTAAPPDTIGPGGAAAPLGAAPGDTATVRRAAGATAWSEEQIARLAEDAARRTPAVSRPAATVRVEGHAARVDLDVVVTHGVHLPMAAEGVRRRVAAGIAAQTGLTVEAVTVTVVDLRLPGELAGGDPGDDREAT